MSSSICVAVVNWNGWRHTVECLESLARQDYGDYQIVVCDNGSRDGSLEKIQAWANGALEFDTEGSTAVSMLVRPPVPKPVSSITYDRNTAERGGREEGRRCRLVLVRLERNCGFAGANNVALRYALARPEFDHFWLLNNDTVVRPDAMTALVGTMRSNGSIGICGSTLLDYDAPTRVQAAGGCVYSRWLGTGFKRMRFADYEKERWRLERVGRVDYVVGASMMVSRTLVEQVGFMDESYFLYFEEIDWARRARGRFSLGYAPGSIVYHKMGASIGGKHSASLRKQFRSEYYFIRNRLRYTARYFPYAMPTVCLAIVGTYLSRVVSGHMREAAVLLRASCRIFRERFGAAKPRPMTVKEPGQ
jgi:GT2 family glycosyltransferase